MNVRARAGKTALAEKDPSANVTDGWPYSPVTSAGLKKKNPPERV